MSGHSISAPSITGSRVGTRSNAWRTTARLAGVAAVLSVALVLASAAATGGDPVLMATSPTGIASSVAALAAMLLLTLSLAGLGALPMMQRRYAAAAGTVAICGTVLVAGGYWASVFVQPGLADAAPQAVSDGLPSVTAGFVASYAVMGLGWILVALTLIRSGLVRASGWVLAVAGLLCISPLPFRYLPISVAVALTIGMRLKIDD